MSQDAPTIDVSRLSQDAALVIVDMQEDFCEPHGALAVKGGRELAGSINNLLRLPFRLKVATKDFHPADHCSFASRHPGAAPFTSSHTITNPETPSGAAAEVQTTLLWPDHCVQGTKGAELIPELDISAVSHTIRKGEDKRVELYSAFGPPFRHPAVGMSSLEQVLRDAGIKRVFACGLAFDYCVKHTAIDAAEAGFVTSIVEDVSRSVDNTRYSEVCQDLASHGVSLVQGSSFGL